MNLQTIGYTRDYIEIYDSKLVELPKEFDIYRFEYTLDEYKALVECVNWCKRYNHNSEFVSRLPNVEKYNCAVKDGIRFEFAYITK